VLVNWLVFLPLSAWILLIHRGGINMAFTSLVIYLAAYALILQWKWRRGDWKETVL
jgi:Na+-driven multidrug efflux pump